MRNRTLLISTIAAALAATAFLAQAQQGGGGGKGGGKAKGGAPVGMIQQIKPGLYIVPGGGATSLVRVTNEGIILVDGKNPGDMNYDPLMEQIKSVTQQPIKFLINTHHHGDHTGNNAKFLAAGVTIIGQANVTKNLMTYTAVNPTPPPPTVTYDKDYTVKLGGVEVQLHHYGPTHTSGDTVVYYPDLKVVAVSDTVTNGQGPLIDYAGGGSATAWVGVLDNILKLDFDTCVPGAGAVMTKAEVQDYRNKYATLIDRAKALVKSGVTKDQLLGQIKSDDIGWTFRNPDATAFYDEISKLK